MRRIFSFGAFLIIVTALFSSCSKEPTKPPQVLPVANAGASQTIKLPTSTVTVAGSGSTTNGNITGYLWTLMSGPNVPVIHSPSSATTVIDGLVEGTYLM